MAVVLVAQDAPPPLPPGIQDVVKLSKAGLGEEIILAHVRNAGVSYNLSADQIIYLNGQGVTQPVIKALLASGSSPNPGPTSPAPTSPPQFAQPLATPSTPAPSVGGPPTGIPSPTPVPGVPPTVGPTSAVGAPVTYDYFHYQLAPYGSWVDVPDYGWSWRPAAAMNPYWRPYCDQGHWVYTDEGWYWQSDYPWGDIPFHYGRWYRDGIGWLWVPGYDRGPAWVAWRHADGYSGWAPLPPAAEFRAGIGLSFRGRVGVDLDFGLAPEAFTFVAYDRFWDHDIHRYMLPRERAEFVFRGSIVMNGYRVDHGRFIVEGVGRERIGLYTHREIHEERPMIHDARIIHHAEMDRRGYRDERHDRR
jgi:hypothetical protein